MATAAKYPDRNFM